MNVLVLGKNPSPIAPVLKETGCHIIERDIIIDVEYLRSMSVNFAVSYGYRHIVPESVIDYLNEKIINLHIAFLPWNRGADPNLWSFLEDTLKGGTIHYINEGLDTGDIIAQKEVLFEEDGETLATTYKKLGDEIVELFKQQWPYIMCGNVRRRRQPSGGSFHKVSDKKKFDYLLSEKGWDTPVHKLIGKALDYR